METEGTEKSIIARRSFLCPHCSGVLTKKFLEAQSYAEVGCPHCDSLLKLPTTPASTVNAPDERQEDRCPATLRVSYTSFSGFISEYTKNISKGGMFILTEHNYSVGTHIELKLHAPNFSEPLHVVCEVMHRDFIEAPHGAKGIGVKFLDIAPESRERLKLIIRSMKGCENI